MSSKIETAKAYGVKALMQELANDTYCNAAYKYVVDVLGDPQDGYVPGTDIENEVAGVNECLAFIRGTLPNVGEACAVIQALEAATYTEAEVYVDDDESTGMSDESHDNGI